MKQTDETQGEYNTEQEVAEALDMLGKGYEAPYEIHMPARILRDDGDGLTEHETGTWIKLSTSFRNVMAKLKGSRLSVFLCICLHINGDNNCYPSLETIAAEAGYSRREVVSAVQELEAAGFLTVKRGEMKSNLYHVNIAAAYGAENAPVHFDAPTSAVRAKNTRQNALKEEPIKKNQKERESIAPDFKNMTVGQARKVPTLKMYSDAAEFFPGSVVWQYVHDTITQHNLTFEKIHAAAVAWGARGFKPSNVQGILEWAVNGSASNGNGSSQSQAKPAINEGEIERTRRMLEEKDKFQKSAPPPGLRPQLHIQHLAKQKGIRS